jgi:hypothetical protein
MCPNCHSHTPAATCPQGRSPQAPGPADVPHRCAAVAVVIALSPSPMITAAPLPDTGSLPGGFWPPSTAPHWQHAHSCCCYISSGDATNLALQRCCCGRSEAVISYCHASIPVHPSELATPPMTASCVCTYKQYAAAADRERKVAACRVHPHRVTRMVPGFAPPPPPPHTLPPWSSLIVCPGPAASATCPRLRCRWMTLRMLELPRPHLSWRQVASVSSTTPLGMGIPKVCVPMPPQGRAPATVRH